MTILTVPRLPDGRADVPPGTNYVVIEATEDTLTIDVDGLTPAQHLNREQLLAKVERLVDELAYLKGRIDAGKAAAVTIKNRTSPTNATVIADVRTLATMSEEHLDLFGKLADRVVGMARIVVDQLDDPVEDED